MDYILKSSKIPDVTLRGVLAYIANQPFVCVKVLNRHGQIVAVSSIGLRLLEADLETIIGKVWADFWTGQHHGDAICALNAAFSGRRGQFTGTFYGTPEPTDWRVESMPLERHGQNVETIVVISTHLPHVDKEPDLLSQEAGLLEMMHKMANISAAAQSAGRLLKGELPKETVAQIAQGLIEVGSQAAEALDACRKRIGHSPNKSERTH